MTHTAVSTAPIAVAPAGPSTGPRTDPGTRNARSAPGRATGRLTVYGDLTCPWSYLASRRASLLEAAGVDLDWRMVEHDLPAPGRTSHDAERLLATRRDLELVSASLLPGERLPHALAGFVPFTGPAVAGYAEAYAAGVGTRVRRLLFDAFWMHGVDLGQARVVRTLLVDAVRSGASPSELVRDWGYAVDVTGAPVSTTAWRLIRAWRRQWTHSGEIVPVVVVEGGPRLHGVEAVEWLGAEAGRRGLDPDGSMHYRRAATRRRPRPSDPVDRYWAAEHGNRWMQERRDALHPLSTQRPRPWI
jgi:hypothetical protein